MHDENIHAEPISQGHEVLLDNLVGTGVGSAAVAEDNDRVGFRIMLPHMFIPHPLNIVAHKLGGVMTCADCNITLVSGDVKYSVRYNLSVRECLEVVVERLGLTNAEDFSVSFEIADKLFLLCVNAYYWQSDGHAFIADLGNMDELGISLGHILHGEILYKGALPEPKLFQYLPDNIICHACSLIVHLFFYLRNGERNPIYVLILGQFCLIWLNDKLERLNPLGMPGQKCLSASSSLTDSPGVAGLAVPEFSHTSADCVFACSHFFTNFAYALARILQMDGNRSLVLSSLALVERCQISEILFREYIRRIFFVHFILLFFTFKVTKNSSDFLIYLAVIQHIILRFNDISNLSFMFRMFDDFSYQYHHIFSKRVRLKVSQVIF